MKKYLIATLVLIFVLMCTLTAYAEDSQTFIEPDIVISADSVSENILWDVYYDAITDKIMMSVSVDTFGVCIYDDSETSYIDGIRVNGETVESCKFPIDSTVSNKIVIRTTYKEDFTGILAQISDGTYDYANLLKNPVALFTIGYYILAMLSVVIGIIAALKGKSKQVKTANEIAGTVDNRAYAAFDVFINKLEPVFKHISDSQENIVEAIVLMNSKDPNAHLEAIECLKKMASDNASQVMSKIKTELTDIIESNKTAKQHTLETLTQIAETAQEESSNENNTDVPIL